MRMKERRMENYIHRENLTCSEAPRGNARRTTRNVILKLLAKEEAKAPTLHKQK